MIHNKLQSDPSSLLGLSELKNEEDMLKEIGDHVGALQCAIVSSKSNMNFTVGWRTS